MQLCQILRLKKTSGHNPYSFRNDNKVTKEKPLEQTRTDYMYYQMLRTCVQSNHVKLYNK